MKQGWERKTLGDIAKFYRGLTYSKGDEADTSAIAQWINERIIRQQC